MKLFSPHFSPFKIFCLFLALTGHRKFWAGFKYVYVFRRFLLGRITAATWPLGCFIPELLFLSLLQPGLWNTDGLQLFWAPWVDTAFPNVAQIQGFSDQVICLSSLTGSLSAAGRDYRTRVLSTNSCKGTEFKCHIPKAMKTVRRYQHLVRYVQYLEVETPCPSERPVPFPTTPTRRTEWNQMTISPLKPQRAVRETSI